MLIEPNEFIKMAEKTGFSTHVFKTAMITISNSMDQVQVAAVQGKRVYFGLDTSFSSINYAFFNKKEVIEHESIYYTDAFKLINHISD